MVDIETYTIEGPEGDTNSVDLPAGLVDALAEQGEDPAAVVGDIVMMGFAQRAHSIVHHSEGEPSADLKDINDAAEDLFEERFGRSLQEMLGHGH